MTGVGRGISKRRWKSAWIRGTVNWDQKLNRNSYQWRVIAVLQDPLEDQSCTHVEI